jgi:CBS domain-containing protein
MLPKVREYMDKVVLTLRPEQGIFAAVDFLLEHHVTGAPVVNDKNEIVGILSEKDCLRLLAAGDGGDVPHGTVEQYMTHAVITVEPNMNIYFAAGMFLNHVVRRFPVVEDGKLVGAITRFDLLRAIHAQLKPLAIDRPK